MFSLKFKSSVLLLTTLIIAGSKVHAAEIPEYTQEQFCIDTVKAKNEENKRGIYVESFRKMGLMFTMFYNPKGMVEVEKLATNENNLKSRADTVQSVGEKIIFAFVAKPELTDEELAKITEISDLWKRFKKLKLYRKVNLKFKLDQESCMALVDSHHDDFIVLQNLDRQVKENYGILNKKKELNAYNGLEDLFEKYTKSGWKIVKTINHTEMFQMLQTNKNISEVLFFLHSLTEQAGDNKQVNTGLLTDASSNLFPYDTFFAFPNNINKVMVMTCHSNEVIDFYKIKQAAHYDFYYAVNSKTFEPIYHGSFPPLARNAFLKPARAETEVRVKPEQKCSVKIDSEKQNHAVTVLLNGRFVGVLTGKSTSIDFDCNRLTTTKNSIKLQYIGNPGMPKSSLEVSSIKIHSASGAVTSLKVTESFKLLQPDEHYETVGMAEAIPE
jgi:hypothetical protein